MDSVTQAALGALCGELFLSKKLGWKGALWGALLGTAPDLDIIAYLWLDAAEQLRWHRGISHSLLILPFVSILFGWILTKIHKTKKLKFTHAAWFVFATWASHIFIDCLNTYGTQIFEPFSDYRFAFNSIFIIDLFFTLPMLLALVLCLFFCKKKPRLRVFLQYTTIVWLSLYFIASLSFKQMAERHFAQKFHEWGVTPIDTMSAPAPLNIFAWRGVARDDEKYYVMYWSLFDSAERESVISEFDTGHHLEAPFRGGKEFESLRWFSQGWRKTYQREEEPNAIYIAALSIGEMHLEGEEENILKPAFIWKLEKEGDKVTLSRAYKMSEDRLMNLGSTITALGNVLERVKGNENEWMKGTWIWDIEKP